MTKRKEHLFQFQATLIAQAAQREADFHKERAAWWDKQYATAAEEAKAKGVEVREYEVTGGKRAQVVIDPGLQQRLEESTRKRSDHQQQADRYEIEAAAYGTQNPELAYLLDAEDVVYFRLAGHPHVVGDE